MLGPNIALSIPYLSLHKIFASEQKKKVVIVLYARF